MTVSLTDLAASRCRLDILEELVESPAPGRELERRLPHESSTVRRNAKTLRDEGWVERRDGVLHLNPQRRFLLEPLLKAVRVMDAYEGAEEFWSTHDLSPIPTALLRDLGLLRDGRVVSGTTADPYRPIEVSSDLMLGSSAVRVISPAFTKEYIELHRRCYDEGIDIDLVLSEEAVDVTRGHPEAVELWRDHRAAGGLSLCHVDECRLVLAVGDGYVALNLPRTGDETVDLSRMFLAEGQEAVAWGERLLRHYRERAEPFEP